MNIINNTYFIGDIYLPEAKPSAGSNKSIIELNQIISISVNDCLLKSLGYVLSRELKNQLDDSQVNGLKIGSDVKWDYLLNGLDYVSIDGVEKHWRGIRFKIDESNENPNVSFLAYYTYFFYEKNKHVNRSNIGNVEEDSKNGVRASNMPKATNAWNKFVEFVQGKFISPSVHTVNFNGYENSVNGIRFVDYYVEGSEVTLYEFIRDMNNLDETNYVGFSPKLWNEINQFDI